jgi:hypothetical protein
MTNFLTDCGLRALPFTLAVLVAPAVHSATPAMPADVVDRLRFGDPASEQAHGLTAEASTITAGALDQPARRFMPLANKDWRGGSAAFRLKVDGSRPNYLSVRLWGGDVNANQATLYCEGKQLGYRHASDVDILDQGSKYAVAPGRFHYVTHPLPLALTRGRNEIACRLRVTGPIWRYGSAFVTFQKPMVQPSRDFHALLVHTGKMVTLDAVEGSEPPSPVRPAQDVNAVLQQVKNRVDSQVEAMWAMKRPANQLEISFLGKTFATQWSKGYQSPRSLAVIVAGIDHLWATYRQDRNIAYYDKATPNEGWFGLGLVGEALKATAPRLQAELDATVKDRDGRDIPRRQALETMFLDSLQWNQQHRRLYTNQSMIKDLYGIWYNNEGLIALGSGRADDRARLLQFFYESVGLQPWTGSLDGRGQPTYAAAEADAKFSVPKDYYETTAKGLTKELGYVGGYGEVLDWVAEIHEATRPARHQAGDSRIRDQLVKIARARSYFRYPHWDEQGYRAMRMEAAIGWRDVYAPGDVIYAQRPSWDASPLQVAVATGDPALLGFARQMAADSQLVPAIEHMMEAPSLRATIGLIDVVDEYAAFTGQHQPLAALPTTLPMTRDQPDFVFADEEDGVVAVRHGKDIIYASLYWRANYGVSGLARVHYVTPVTDRMATVALDRQEFEPAGLSYTRPNNPHINGHRFSIRYPDDGDVWSAGEQQPVARLPAGARYVPGEDSAYAGRADYYELRYGPYLFAMNSSKGKTFTVSLPAREGNVQELVSGAIVKPATASLALKPGTTAVLYLGAQQQ